MGAKTSVKLAYKRAFAPTIDGISGKEAWCGDEIQENNRPGGGVSVRSGIDWRRPGDCGLCRAEERGGSRGELAGVRRESGGSLRGEKL